MDSKFGDIFANNKRRKLTMDDLISRQAAIALAYFHGKTATWDNPTPDGVDAVDVADLEKLPAVQIEPKSGREPSISLDKVIEIVNERLMPLKKLRYPQSKYQMILDAYNESTIKILESIIDAVKANCEREENE